MSDVIFNRNNQAYNTGADEALRQQSESIANQNASLDLGAKQAEDAAGRAVPVDGGAQPAAAPQTAQPQPPAPSPASSSPVSTGGTPLDTQEQAAPAQPPAAAPASGAPTPSSSTLGYPPAPSPGNAPPKSGGLRTITSQPLPPPASAPETPAQLPPPVAAAADKAAGIPVPPPSAAAPQPTPAPSAPGPSPQRPAAAVDPARISMALRQQESGNNPNVPTSIDGAVGVGQIMPATFQAYARPGENINDPADNMAVHQRIVDDLYNDPRVKGDPARIAVGYFSGKDNIAPANSPTPWLRDYRDGNGTSTSTYVSQVLGRLGSGPQPYSGDITPNAPSGLSGVSAESTPEERGIAANSADGSYNPGDYRLTPGMGGAAGGYGQVNYGQMATAAQNRGGRGAGLAAIQFTKDAADQRTAAQLRQDEMEKQAVIALGKGDMTTFGYFAQRTGMRVPPSVLADGNQRQLFARGMLMAEQAYKDDPGAAGMFVTTYMKNGGDVVGAAQAAGIPKKLSLGYFQRGDQMVYGLLNSSSTYGAPNAEPVTNPQGQEEPTMMPRMYPSYGAPVQGIDPATGQPTLYDTNKRTGALTPTGIAAVPKPGGAAGVFDAKRSAWLQIHPGDDDGALAYANGQKSMNPQEVQATAARMAAEEATAQSRQLGAPPFDWDGALRKYTAILGGGAPGAPGLRGVNAGTGAPPQQPESPPPAPQGQGSLVPNAQPQGTAPPPPTRRLDPSTGQLVPIQ